ncbi:hypothetical protein [Streptomyces sp. NPDC017520]|uniref:hypothetical protein n=1 Tax=Streptomyces sp. NPDC017520 TaxID=3364998 RepID=UPI0037B0F6E1
MGPVVVVPFLHGPTPPATAPAVPGRPAVSPTPSPAPSGSCPGGRAVSPPPPPASDDRGTDFPGRPGGGAEGASRTTGDDEKASRVPRGDAGGIDAVGDIDVVGDEEDPEDEPDDENEEESHGNRGDADDEWDD